MIPDHIITKALNAWIGDHNCPHPDQISIYRVLITRSLEAVAADIWEEGARAMIDGHDTNWINDQNPYRNETA